MASEFVRVRSLLSLRTTMYGSGEQKLIGCSWQKQWGRPLITHRGWVAQEMQRLTETLPRVWRTK